MKIGIPKETAAGETRVAAVPDTVAKMTKAGMEVLVETGAGAASYMRDEDYIKAGAKVTQGAEELFKEADVILKVQKPLMNDRAKKHEIDMMREGVVLITFLQPMANLERGGVRSIKPTTLIVPPMKEPIAEMPRAGPALPLRAIW